MKSSKCASVNEMKNVLYYIIQKSKKLQDNNETNMPKKFFFESWTSNVIWQHVEGIFKIIIDIKLFSETQNFCPVLYYHLLH